MDDFGGFGGGDAPDDGGFGGFDDAPPPAETKQFQKKKKGNRNSSRGNLYAKSPMQRRQEQAAAQEYEAMLQAEQAKQAGDTGGFGGFDDMNDNAGMGNGMGDPFGAAAAAPKPNVWGAPTTMGGIVIPPFVPRDQRNAKVWDVGKVKKSQSDKTILAAEKGGFLIRETMKGDRHVVCVNDNGGLFEMYIRHVPDGGFMFMSRQFDDLSAIVKHLERNAMYNKNGLPLYIDKPVRML